MYAGQDGICGGSESRSGASEPPAALSKTGSQARRQGDTAAIGLKGRSSDSSPQSPSARGIGWKFPILLTARRGPPALKSVPWSLPPLQKPPGATGSRGTGF